MISGIGHDLNFESISFKVLEHQLVSRITYVGDSSSYADFLVQEKVFFFAFFFVYFDELVELVGDLKFMRVRVVVLRLFQALDLINRSLVG